MLPMYYYLLNHYACFVLDGVIYGCHLPVSAMSTNMVDAITSIRVVFFRYGLTNRATG